MQNYSGAVPAVQKTIAALEHLRSSDAAPTLTELAQALAVNRSTLLAVLNTLRAAGFVTRDEADRYHLGPGLLAYGPSAARTSGAAEAFDRPAQWLVDTLGESVALVRLTAGGATCVAFKMGRYAVRSVVELGQITPLSRSAGGLAILAAMPDAKAARIVDGPVGAPGESGRAASGVEARGAADDPLGLDWPGRLATIRKCNCAYVEDSAEVGQAALAAPVCDAEGRTVAAIELLAPLYRLGGEGLRSAGRMVIAAARQASLALGCWSYEPYKRLLAPVEPWRGTRAAALQGPELDRFLELPWVASLACLRDTGYPYTVPVWYEWRQGCLWLVPRTGARWLAYLRAHPRVSMTISEPSPPFRRVLVEGLAEETCASPVAVREIERRLATRYLGPDAGSYLETAGGRAEPAIRIVPEKITSWEGLTAHPRYRSSASTWPSRAAQEKPSRPAARGDRRAQSRVGRGPASP